MFTWNVSISLHAHVYIWNNTDLLSSEEFKEMQWRGRQTVRDRNAVARERSWGVPLCHEACVCVLQTSTTVLICPIQDCFSSLNPPFSLSLYTVSLSLPSLSLYLLSSFLLELLQQLSWQKDWNVSDPTRWMKGGVDWHAYMFQIFSSRVSLTLSLVQLLLCHWSINLITK